jgi:hypothetical protein
MLTEREWMKEGGGGTGLHSTRGKLKVSYVNILLLKLENTGTLGGTAGY